jgi:hypothetical protein
MEAVDPVVRELQISMSLPDLIGRFVGPLARLDVPYMVIGGVAAIVYSEPRYTQDLDLLMRLDPDHAAEFAESSSSTVKAGATAISRTSRPSCASARIGLISRSWKYV